jgi:hypothetical protein
MTQPRKPGRPRTLTPNEHKSRKYTTLVTRDTARRFNALCDREKRGASEKIRMLIEEALRAQVAE